MALPTPTDVLTYIAPISEYLASNDVSNGALYGEPTNPMLPIQLYVETESLRYRYLYEDIAGAGIASQSLIGFTNYVYGLCGKYGLAALALINSGGAVPGVGGVPQLYGIPISGSYIALADGETVITLNLPAGAIVVQVFKSINWLETSDYTWVQPTLTLLNGISMSMDEKLSFLYVVPV